MGKMRGCSWPDRWRTFTDLVLVLGWAKWKSRTAVDVPLRIASRRYPPRSQLVLLVLVLLRLEEFCINQGRPEMVVFN